MNWYRRIKLAASPKNIVNQWKVDDPFLKFFIYTYEPLINLGKIKSKEDLVAHIQEELLPSLREKINPQNPNANYMKDMPDEAIHHELQEHQHDHRVQGILRRLKQDPSYMKEAKKILLKAINEDKQKSFDRWWKYMEEDYGDNPAFLFSVLNPMIESSPATQKNGPPPAHREAVALIADEIGTKGVTQMNIPKKFNKTSFKLDKETSKAIDTSDKACWIRTDSKQRDPGDYRSNQEKLMRFSTGSGWCIAQERMSDTYLSKGDFWQYFENKRPKVAIRLEGPKHVAEIRGTYNKQETLDPYWQQVTDFLHETDFDYTSHPDYKRLQKIMFANADLENNPEAYKSLMKAIKADPTQLGMVSDENKRKFPELVKAAAVGYETKLNKLLDAVENIPTIGNEYQTRFGQFQDMYADIPDEVKPYMSQDIEGRLVEVHKKAFLRNPIEFENFPPEMQAQITDQEKKIAWTFYVGNDPYRYNDLRIPAEVRKMIPIQPIIDGWDRLIDLNINHVDNIPSYVLERLPQNYVKNKVISDFKRYPCNRDKHGFDKLRRVQEMGLMTPEEIAQTYVEAVQRNPKLFSFIPPQYKEHVKMNMQGDLSGISQKHLQEVMYDASYFNSIPDEQIQLWLIQNRTNEVISSFLKLKDVYGGNIGGWWKVVPEPLKPLLPEPVKTEVANFYVKYVPREQIDPVLQPYLTASNWYRRLIKA